MTIESKLEELLVEIRARTGVMDDVEVRLPARVYEHLLYSMSMDVHDSERKTFMASKAHVMQIVVYSGTMTVWKGK